jgi:CRP-like cAMP-binding protein
MQERQLCGMSDSKPQSERAQALKGIAILGGVTSQALNRLAAACRWSKHTSGQHIVSYLAPSTDIYFLISGRVRVLIYSSEGKPVHFAVLEAPAMFGEIAAIDRGPRSATIEALEACAVGLLSAVEFEKLLLQEPSVAMATLRQLTAEVRRLSERVVDFSTLAVHNRIHGELLRLAVAAGERDGAAVLSPAPSLLDIASRVSTHREAVSRELSRMTGLGIIMRKGGDLHVIDMARLTRLVREAKSE